MQPKSERRRAALLHRAALSAAQREAAGVAITRALRDVVLQAARVAAYLEIGTEPPTSALVSLRTDVLLPVLLPDGDLDWRTGEPGGPLLGPDAVAGCDVVLVPALAVDRRGNRLGRGGGSYDRALRRATGLTIALLYDGEWVDDLPAEPHDVPVAAVVTPAAGLQLVTG